MSESEYVMPSVHLGQVVAWYEAGEKSRQPALLRVTKINSRLIEGQLLSPGAEREKFSVRHVDDPALYSQQAGDWRRRFGAWDYSDADKALNDRLKSLEDRLGALEGNPAGASGTGDVPSELTDEDLRLAIREYGRAPNRAWDRQKLWEELTRLRESGTTAKV